MKIESADSDKSGALSKDEILDHQDVFVGSQATGKIILFQKDTSNRGFLDWGDAIVRHDEF